MDIVVICGYCYNIHSGYCYHYYNMWIVVILQISLYLFMQDRGQSTPSLIIIIIIIIIIIVIIIIIIIVMFILLIIIIIIIIIIITKVLPKSTRAYAQSAY